MMTARYANTLVGATKSTAERLLVAAGIPVLRRLRHRRDTIVLAYHNVVPDDQPRGGDASLHLRRADFVAQIEALARSHDIVPLTSILDIPREGRCRAVITFDDAYAGALEIAIPELARRGIPATVFVAPGLLGKVTWWDATADRDAGGVPPAVRDRALTRFAGNGEAVLTSVEFAHDVESTRCFRIATEEEVRGAARHGGIHFGSHTWTHSNLAVLSSDAVAHELHASRTWLETHFPAAFVPWLSYPYGLWSHAVESLATRAGYTAALRVDGGWCDASSLSRRFALPRMNVPAGLSLAGFRIRTGC